MSKEELLQELQDAGAICQCCQRTMPDVLIAISGDRKGYEAPGYPRTCKDCLCGVEFK